MIHFFFAVFNGPLFHALSGTWRRDDHPFSLFCSGSLSPTTQTDTTWPKKTPKVFAAPRNSIKVKQMRPPPDLKGSFQFASPMAAMLKLLDAQMITRLVQDPEILGTSWHHLLAVLPPFFWVILINWRQKIASAQET